MSRPATQTVVVGGGIAGIAVALRLAKLGDAVTLVERSPHLGGPLRPVEHEGFSFDSSPTAWLMPAALRDLFRKSGRPLEAELGGELAPVEVLREHRFIDRTTVRLPGSSIVAQRDAFDALTPGLGEQWLEHVAAYNDLWDVLRREWFETPTPPEELSGEVVRVLKGRETLNKRFRRDFADERLDLVAGYPFTSAGHELRNVPSWMGVHAYLEQNFGGWRIPGGVDALLAAFDRRLATRGVEVLTGHEATDVAVDSGRAAGIAVRPTGGAAETIEADTVVCAIDPRRLPALARPVRHTMPALPPLLIHLGLDTDSPEPLAGIDHELVLHGDAMLTLRPGGTAPAGASAWTLQVRGKLGDDPLRALARAGIDLREHVVARLDRTPRQSVEEWGGSPWGTMWEGRTTASKRLGPFTPIEGVYAAGAHTRPGGDVHYALMSAAMVAGAIHPESLG